MSIVLMEPYSDSWMLPSSTKLKNRSMNAWVYEESNEIKRDSRMLFAGYAVSLGTLVYLGGFLPYCLFNIMQVKTENRQSIIILNFF